MAQKPRYERQLHATRRKAEIIMPLSHDQKIALLRRTIELAEISRAAGNHPFGSLLADADGAILIEAGNTHGKDGGPGHAETNVARQAAIEFDAEMLSTCALITSVEPCVMCAGASYWAGIGTVIFGVTEKRLAELTGDNPENLTMDMPCEDVFAAGQRATHIEGPFAELENAITAAHKDFW